MRSHPNSVQAPFAGSGRRVFTATLNWFRHVDASDHATLADLNLALYNYESLTNLGTTPVQQSISPVDNVEHVYLDSLPAGDLALTAVGRVRTKILNLGEDSRN